MKAAAILFDLLPEKMKKKKIIFLNEEITSIWKISKDIVL